VLLRKKLLVVLAVTMLLAMSVASRRSPTIART